MKLVMHKISAQGWLYPAMIFSLATMLGGCIGGGGDDGDNPPQDNDVGSITIGGAINGASDVLKLTLNGTSQSFAGSSFTFDRKLGRSNDEMIGGQYVYEVKAAQAPSGQKCTVTNGSGTTLDNIDNIIVTCEDLPLSGGQYSLCDSHAVTEMNVVGNNTYEFIAGNDACFGLAQDTGTMRREVPVIFSTSAGNSDKVSLSANAKLSLREDSLYKTIHIAFEISNISDGPVCIDPNQAYLQDENSAELSSMRLEIFGDMYFDKDATFISDEYYDHCIPANQTRMMWASLSYSHILPMPDEVITNLDHIRADMTIELPDELAGDYFLEALSPNGAIWSSSHNVIGGEFEIKNDFINMSDKTVTFKARYVNALYFDEHGYITEAARFGIYDANNDGEISVDEYIADPLGGMISISDAGSIVTNEDISPIFIAYIPLKATKLVVNLDICDGIIACN